MLPEVVLMLVFSTPTLGESEHTRKLSGKEAVSSRAIESLCVTCINIKAQNFSALLRD